MSTETVRILRVYKSDKDKNGNVFKSKNNKPFWKVAIQVDKYGQDWFSKLCFAQDDDEMNLKEGDEKLLSLYEENGYKNFKIPTKLDLLTARVEKIESYLKEKESKLTSAGTKVPDFSEVDIKPEDIPF